MSDDLVISGGGSVAVASDELFSQQQRLRHVADELDHGLHSLRSIDESVTRSELRNLDAPLSAMRAEQAIEDAITVIGPARDCAGRLASGLEMAATAYGKAEAVEAGLAQQLSADIAYQLGLWAPVIGLFAMPTIIATGIGAAIGLALAPDETRERAGKKLSRASKELLNDPKFVAFLRLAASSADDAGEGLIRMPPGLNHLLGDEGLGILGVGSSAAVVAALAGTVGVLRETGVSVKATSRKNGPPPPTGYEERARRIPSGDAEIRIDRYSGTGGPDRFEVYLGGTADTSPIATTEPWDMTSNVTAMAGGNAASYDAARQAMRDAGIDASSPVVFNGYSQGGLLAARLAASGGYDARGLFTVGGPCGGVDVPHDIPYLAIEHSDDLVPALGGVWKSSDPVLVTRELFDDHTDLSETMLPAHELANYRETARLADGSGEQRIVDVGDSLRRFGTDAVGVTTTLYRAERTSSR